MYQGVSLLFGHPVLYIVFRVDLKSSNLRSLYNLVDKAHNSRLRSGYLTPVSPYFLSFK